MLPFKVGRFATEKGAAAHHNHNYQGYTDNVQCKFTFYLKSGKRAHFDTKILVWLTLNSHNIIGIAWIIVLRYKETNKSDCTDPN